jgi:uncharacterized protein CbrC (UPF0167 family)
MNNTKFSAYVKESCTNFIDEQCDEFVKRVVERTPELTDEQRAQYLSLEDQYLLGEKEMAELNELYGAVVIRKYFNIFFRSHRRS